MEIYLVVPYAEKDTVKSLGAKWDARVRRWYVPAGRSPAKFEQWMTEECRAVWRRHYGLRAHERTTLKNAARALGAR